jgi:glycosyltransferase involved in cell wall biosynthesis
MGSAGPRPKVLIIGPLPPPAFGVAKATQLMLESEVLAARLQILHLDTTDVAGFATMGSPDWHNFHLGIRHSGQLVHLLWRERPDVTLVTASQGKFALMRDWLFVSLSRAFGARVVTYLRGGGYAELRARQGRIAARTLRSILKHSSRVIVLGENLVDMAHAVHPAGQVAVVPNGCSPAVRPDRVGSRESDHPVVAYVGRLSHDKGLEDALTAAPPPPGQVPTLESVFGGEWDSPSYGEQIEAQVHDYGLSHAVRFPGPVTGQDKEDLLARAWVLIVPSHSEGQPWVIIEAMSAGVPVVATATGAIPETVQDGVTGFVVPVGDSDAMAERITRLATDDALWKRMSEAAVERYRKYFTVERSHTLLADELCKVARGE